ncbi:Protein F37C4.5 [Termitomyces sp. T112]|nr:Protein F37C4.5 [Termitomyces sp. T112]
MSTTSTLRLNAADDTIKSVTIFKSSKAEVVRQFSLNLKAGQTKVEISGLSESIDTQSVRVSGLEQARLYDVVCTIGGGKDMSYVPDSPSEIIRLLQVKKHALESEKRVREHEADLLMNYAKTLSGEHVLPNQMNTFLESFVERGRKNIKDIAELDEKIIALGRQIERETEKGIAKKCSVQGEVIIILGTDNPSVVDLKLTYVVGNVSWTPTYELHAKAENGKPLHCGAPLSCTGLPEHR